MPGDTINRAALTLGAVVASAWLLVPTLSAADEVDSVRPAPNANAPRETTVETKVESRADGVYIQISVRQKVAGSRGSGSSGEAGSPSANAQGRIAGSSGANSAPATSGVSGGSGEGAARPGRSWTDRNGYNWESPTGQVITLTPPNISTATRESWMQQMQQRPNENPYLLYVDRQFNGVIWVPRSAGSSSNIVLGPAPSNAPQQAATSGNGNSTDPREVALDALGSQPLPDAQIRMNPSLGLVAMPAWFWVEGYDGSSFGTSRTVEIPPEVGSDVPLAVVPANDPRRQGTSFTVEVRLWPTRYQWSFGDGATAITQTLGRPYPAQSDIQHSYEFSSLRFPSGFPVSLTIEFAAEYRVNGGAPQPLPPIQRTYTAGYRVQEVQPVLTNSR